LSPRTDDFWRGNVSIQSRGYDLFRELVAARAHESILRKQSEGERSRVI
jgi:hypothetical protein